MMNEMPTMLAAAYGSANQFSLQAKDANSVAWDSAARIGIPKLLPVTTAMTVDRTPPSSITLIAKEPAVAYAKRRLVRVLVVDPSDSVPVDKCLLHAGQEQFTDATDQELFFDIDIRSILDTHNAYRITLDDKSSKAETPKKLEPARIRDLKMVVVTLAEF